MNVPLRFLAALWLVTAITGHGQNTAPARSPNDVLATGKSWKILRDELDEIYKRHETEVINSGRIVPEGDKEPRQAYLLDNLVFNRCVGAIATPADRQRAQATVEKFFVDAKVQYGGDEGFLRQIRRMGFNEALLRRLKIDEAVVLEVVNRELRSKIKIPDAEIQKYYDERAANFDRPETFKIAHILVSTRDNTTGEPATEEQKKERRLVAEQLLARVKRGEDFNALARQKSDDFQTRDQGGEMTFTHGQVVVELEAAVAALTPGQVSGVVETHQGFHIIKSIEHTRPGRIPLSEALPDIRATLVQNELERRLPEWYDAVRAAQDVRFTPLAPRRPAAQPATPATPKDAKPVGAGK